MENDVKATNDDSVVDNDDSVVDVKTILENSKARQSIAALVEYLEDLRRLRNSAYGQS